MTQQETSEFVTDLRRTFNLLEVRRRHHTYSEVPHPSCAERRHARIAPGSYAPLLSWCRLCRCPRSRWWMALHWGEALSWRWPATCACVVRAPLSVGAAHARAPAMGFVALVVHCHEPNALAADVSVLPRCPGAVCLPRDAAGHHSRVPLSERCCILMLPADGRMQPWPAATLACSPAGQAARSCYPGLWAALRPRSSYSQGAGWGRRRQRR